MSIHPLTATCGDVIAADAEWPTLEQVPDRVVQDRFATRGVLVLRGFDANVRSFDTFARRFSKSFMPGVGRSTFPEFKLVHLVNETLDALAPHTDNGTRPEDLRPDITWMLCERPADADGETTVFDGIAIWERLSPPTQAVLRERTLMFSTRYAAMAWRGMGFTTVDAFRTFVESMGATMKPPTPDGAVEIAIKTSAHRITHYGSRDAFVSSLLLAGAKGFEQLRVSFEDGDVPADMLAEITAAIDSSCERIEWVAGDIAMLDNTRILHGRRAYRDTQRRLYLLQTHKASF